MANRVAVMYLGKIVELAPKDALFANPMHPYTRTLLMAIPRPDPHRKGSRQIPGGDVPSPMDPPSGCRFHTRCPFMTELCKQEEPKLRVLATGHAAACHHAEQLPPAEAAEGVHETAPVAAKRMALYAERRGRVAATAG
jgi:oligopeptide transport system ATP-binding protein